MAALASPRRAPAAALLSLLSVAMFATAPVRADLPVHCLIQDVVGEWTFSEGKTSHELGSQLTACGHSIPNDAISMAKIDVEAAVGEVGTRQEGSFVLVWDRGGSGDFLSAHGTNGSQAAFTRADCDGKL